MIPTGPELKPIVHNGYPAIHVVAASVPHSPKLNAAAAYRVAAELSSESYAYGVDAVVRVDLREDHCIVWLDITRSPDPESSTRAEAEALCRLVSQKPL